MQSPSFDSWTTIFLFAAIQGVFVSIVLCFIKKENRTNNILLALMLFLFSVTLIEYVFYWTKYITWYPHIMAVSAAFPFLFGVILYLYFRNVFQGKPVNRKDAIHLVPFAVNILYQLPLYLSSSEVKRQWLRGHMVSPSLFNWPDGMNNFYAWIPWLQILHMSCYAYVIYRSYQAFSKTNAEVRTWFLSLSGLYLLFLLSFTSYYVLSRFSFFNSTWDYMISFAMTFFIYFIAWFGYLQPRIFSGFSMTDSIKISPRYQNSALDNEVSKEILMKLEGVMQEKKLFLENDLRLESLAKSINVSKHHLSQVINEHKGMNFFEYVNHQRVNEAMELLATSTKKELNVIDVAYAVGFNNKVSFNTTFKKITGKTPTEFRKEAENGKINQEIR